MATTKLSKVAAMVERGYGQVEPNHLSAQRTGQIYAQLPAAANIDVLENGQFVKYNYAEGVVDLAGEGEWMLVYNEVKLYDARHTEADFAMVKTDYAARVYDAAGNNMPENTTMVPRVFKTNVGDIMTLNTITDATVAAKAILTVDSTTGYLKAGEGEGMQWQVAKVTTMPDGQKAVKVIRIA